MNITIQRNPIRYNQKAELLVVKVLNESINLHKESISSVVKAGKASCVLKILLEAVSMRSINEKMVRINLDYLNNVECFKKRMKVQEENVKVSEK
uniref:Uncharacterized protein n=1 Tax=Strongyloides venezuelensis TaxID=75913 RepID=A0A0K0EYY1_STRVS